MRAALIIGNRKEARQGNPPGRVSYLAAGLPTKIYFVSELLVLLVALAVLFAVGTSALLLLILLQEGMRWSVRQIIEAKQRTLLSRGAPSC